MDPSPAPSAAGGCRNSDAHTLRAVDVSQREAVLAYLTIKGRRRWCSTT